MRAEVRSAERAAAAAQIIATEQSRSEIRVKEAASRSAVRLAEEREKAELRRVEREIAAQARLAAVSARADALGAKRMTETAAKTRLATHEAGNLAAQVQDIGVSLAGGQSPFLVLTQQGGQIGQIFANAGLSLRAFAGAVATSIAGMLPLVAVIGAVSLAVDFLIKKFTEQSSKNKELAKDYAELSKYLGGVIPSFNAQNAAIDQGTAALAIYNDNVRSTTLSLREQAQAAKYAAIQTLMLKRAEAGRIADEYTENNFRKTARGITYKGFFGNEKALAQKRAYDAAKAAVDNEIRGLMDADEGMFIKRNASPRASAVAAPKTPDNTPDRSRLIDEGAYRDAIEQLEYILKLQKEVKEREGPDLTGFRAAGDIPFADALRAQQDEMREVFSQSFADGLQAALDGDLKDFLAFSLRQAALKGFEGLGSAIFDGAGSKGSGFFSAVASIFGRASGGNVVGGRPYVVGENGPEIMVPAQSGYVQSNNRLGGGRQVVNQTFEFNNPVIWRDELENVKAFAVSQASGARSSAIATSARIGRQGIPGAVADLQKYGK